MRHGEQDRPFSHLEDLKPGEHICFIYDNPEAQRGVGVAFIAAGLGRGEKCLYIAGDVDAPGLIRYFAEEGIDVEEARQAGRLIITDAFESLSESRGSSGERTATCLRSEAIRACEEGYPSLRVMADMSLVSERTAGNTGCLARCAALERVLSMDYPVIAMCQYDMTRFSANDLARIIITHPTVLRGSQIMKNPCYVPPGERDGIDAEGNDLSDFLLAVLERGADAEERCRQAEERFRTVADFTHDWEYWIDPNGDFIYCSPSCERITGHKPAEFLENPLLLETIAFPEDRARVRDHICQEKKVPGESELDFRIIGKDGNVRWIAHACRHVCDGNGVFVGRRASNRDITKRKLMEESLRISEEKYRTLVESTDDAIILVDEFRNIAAANAGFVKLFGHSENDVKGASTRIIHLSEESYRRYGEEVYPVVAKNGTARIEWELAKKDGRGVFCETAVSVLSRVGGQPGGYVHIMRDVTKEKRIREIQQAMITTMSFLNRGDTVSELLRNTVEFLRGWLGCDALGIRLKDGYDFPYYESRGFPGEFILYENSLGARDEKGELLIDPTGNPVLECMCGNVIMGRFDASFPFFTQNGSFWSNCTTELLASTTEEDRQARTRNRCNGMGYESVGLFPLRIGETPFGLIQVNNIARDFFTPELVSFLERLADSVVIGIAQRQAKEKLESSLREKDELLKELYHRVKNNLQIVSGLLYLGGSRTDNHEVLSIITDARNRIEVMALIHSRLYRSGNFEKISMGAHIKEIVTYLSQIYLDRRTGISCQVKAENIELALDQAMPCALVLNELVSNAFKHAFGAAGQGEVLVSMAPEEGDAVCVSVMDNGIGVPAGFDLQQTESTGLSLAKNLVEGQLKGTMRLDRDKGTEFSFRFRKRP